MPVAEETSSKIQLDSPTTAKIGSKDLHGKIKKSSVKTPKAMCDAQKLKQQQQNEKHVSLILNSFMDVQWMSSGYPEAVQRLSRGWATSDLSQYGTSYHCLLTNTQINVFLYFY